MSRIKNHLRQSARKIKKVISNENFLILTYKLSYDALFILLFSFTLVLIAESLLPGIITSHISLLKLSLPLLVVFAGIIFVGKRLDRSYPKKRLGKNRLAPILIAASFLMVGNSLLQFALWENIIITLLTLSIFILFYKLLSSD